MLVTRKGCNCNECPLRGQPKVESEWNLDAQILILGESPGTNEVENGIPFFPEANAGSILKFGMQRAGLRREICYIMNLILCQPPDNKLGSDEGRQALRCCRPGLERELYDALANNNIKVILALGNFPADYFKCAPGSTITEIRGYVFDYKGIPIIPTFHPSYVYRQRSQKGGEKSSLNGIWGNDLKKVNTILKEGYTKPEYHFNMFPTLSDVKAFRDKVVATRCLVATDTETNGIKAYKAKLDLIGFADSATTGISIPYFKQGGAPYFSEEEWPIVLQYAQDILNYGQLVCHNAGYDVGVLRSNGFTVPDENIKHDTTIGFHVLYPELEKKLNFVASVMTTVPFWKDVLKGRKGSHRNMEDREFRWYNAQDCMNLFPVLEAILALIHRNEYLNEIYYNEAMPLVPVILRIVSHGMWIDPKNLKVWCEHVFSNLEKVEHELIRIGNLPKGFNINSGDDVRAFLFGIKPAKFAKVSELTATKDKRQFVWKCQQCDNEALSTKSKKPKIDDICSTTIHTGTYYNEQIYAQHKWKRTDEVRIIQVPKMKSGTGKEQSLLDLKEMADNLKPIYLHPNYKPKFTKNKKRKGENKKTISTDDLAITSYVLALNKRLEGVRTFTRNPTERDLEIAKIEQLLSWLKNFSEYKGWEKLRSTYTEYDLDKQGRVHTSLDQAGTATRRLSSKDPNLQNIPLDEEDAEVRIRDIFAAPPGWVLIDADYSQLEVVVLAYMTEDRELIRVIEEHLKLHDENTKALFEIDSSHPKWKMLRKVSKKFQFASIQYGGQDKTILDMILTEVPDCGLTLAQYGELKRRYFAKYPQIEEWQNKTKEFAEKNGYVLNGFGARRQLTGNKNDIIKKSWNTPIQGTAAEIVARSMIRVDRDLLPHSNDMKMILQVHDELILEVRDTPETIEQAKSILSKGMLTPVTFMNGRTPMLEIDMKVGKTWGIAH